MKSAILKIVKAVVFCGILWLLIAKAGYELRLDTRESVSMRNFYEMEDNSLDAIVVGSSAIYRYWQPGLAYQEHGFTSQIIHTGGQDIHMVPYLLDEVLKTQDPDVIVVEVRRLVQEYQKKISNKYNKKRVNFHTSNMISDMPLNLNKIRIIKNVMKLGASESLEYAVPLLKYHENFYSMTKEEMEHRDSLHTAEILKTFPINTIVPQEFHLYAENELPEMDIPESVFYIFDDIVEAANKKGTKILFISSPYNPSGENQAITRAMEKYLETKGYDYIDMVSIAESEIGIDFSKDFYNANHVNATGAKKFTLYLGDCLAQNYEFTTSLSDKSREWWDNFSEEFSKVLAKRLKGKKNQK